MLYDLSGVFPFFVVLAVLALLGSVVSIGVLGHSVVGLHRDRVAKHQSIPAYYRRFVLAH
jgi:hypothetical protein